MAERADVVVIGGRCGGSAVARLLAEAGLRVIVVDRATFPSDTVSTSAVAAHGQVLLERWGLLERLRATDLPTPRAIGVKLGALELPDVPVPERSPGTMAPRRTVLDALLVEAAREAGAAVWEGTSFIDVVWEDGAVAGAVVRRRGEQVRIEAPLVIGADGLRSRVAGIVGAPTYDSRPSAVSGVYAFYADTGLAVSELAFHAGELALAFLTNDGLVCIGVAAHEKRFAELTDGDIAVQRHVERVSPRLADMLVAGARVSRFVAFRARPAHLRVPWGRGWALVGDAGCYKDPVTGQGIADAFLSAQLLAEAVVAGLGGAVALDDAMQGFHHRRDELQAEMYEVTAEMSRLEWTEEELVQLFMRYRELSESALDAVLAMGERAPMP